MTTIQILSIVGGIIVIVRFLYDGYKAVFVPNATQDTEIAILKTQFNTMSSELATIKNNHLAHIETDVRELQKGQEKIFTILEERLPHKRK